jgi:hypothetical protein
MNLFLVPKVEEVLNWHQLQVLGVVGLGESTLYSPFFGVVVVVFID